MNAISKLLKFCLLSAAVFFGGAAVQPRPANAQLAVVCPNCSNIFTQILEHMQQLAQYAKQVDQYAKQLLQLEDQLKNSMKLPFAVFDDALRTVRTIEATMNQAKNIGYTWANLDVSFKNMFPDTYAQYQDVRNLKTSWERFEADSKRSERTYDAALSALKAARDQSRDLSADQQRMNEVGRHVTDADGRMDALQAAGEYAQHSAQQIMKLRQIGLLQVQLMAQAQADEQQRLNLERAASQVWIEDKPADPVATPNSSQNYRRAGGGN